MLIRDIIARMRHGGCGGRPGRAELLTGIEGASRSNFVGSMSLVATSKSN
jgi:hypothetical protein